MNTKRGKDAGDHKLCGSQLFFVVNIPGVMSGKLVKITEIIRNKTDFLAETAKRNCKIF